MNRLVNIITLLFVMLLSISAHAKDRVLLIGDSEAYLLKSEFAQLAKQDNVEFEGIAYGGSSVIQWSHSLHSEWNAVYYFRPTIVLVSLGANDACMSRRVVKNEQPYLERFMNRLNQTRAQVIWIGPPKIGIPPPGINSKLPQAIDGLEAFASMIRKNNIRYLDARTIEIPMWADQLHCYKPYSSVDETNGCMIWANWVWGQLRIK